MKIPTNKLFENLTNQTFGRLTVVEYIGAKYPNKRTKGHQWLCKCECGNEIVVLGGSLKSNNTNSCGCYHKQQTHNARFIDLTGNKYSRLTVVKFVEIKYGQPYWLCKCECGNEKNIAGNSLKSNKTKSCGCKQGNLKHGLWGTPEYRKMRMSNPVIRLQHNVSVSVRDAIRERNGKKSGRTFNHLPYTVQQLKEHLEKQFEPWMNWDNYGGKNDSIIKTWHIDHVVPHCKFDYKNLTDPSFQMCWSLYNLRPLEKIENIRRGNR
jgi:hypothetical protein